MILEEHHIDGFDAPSFFSFHDYDGSGAWTADEIRKTYGLDDESNNGASEESKQKAVQDVINLYDTMNSGEITRDDFLNGIAIGVRLPDLGFGPGHHGDLEYEYEIHHFEVYHGDDAKEEDLSHPEDIEHFQKHDQMEAEEARIERLEKTQIVESNIPQKFLKAGY